MQEFTKVSFDEFNSKANLILPNNNQDEIFWEKILNILKSSLGESTFNGWVKDLKIEKLEDKFLYIRAKSRFIKDWVEQNYIENIKLACASLDKKIYKVEIKVEKLQEQHLEQNAQKTNQQILENSEITDDLFVKKINLHYSFENFVVGKSNQLAFNVCKKIAEGNKLLDKSNLVYLYGDVGNGKTHLLQSIRNNVLFSRKQVKIEYFSIERFIFNFVKSLQTNQIMNFKDKFKDIDILLIDDFQFINGKKGTQEEFLHILNSLISLNKQIVVACDRSVSMLMDINESIKSRLAGGLIVDIKPSDVDIRFNFSKQKLMELFKEEDELNGISTLLSEKINSSMRELEGAINKLKLNCEIFSTILNKENVACLLEENIFASNVPISIDKIKKKVCEFYNITLSDLNSVKRTRNITVPRHIAMYLVRKHTSLSLPEIGKNFGAKDHSSILYAIKKVEEYFKKDLAFQCKFKDLERSLRS
jgi:chromosomal replication initiator protein